MLRLPSVVIARQEYASSKARRGTLQRVIFSLFAATIATQQVESWSRAGRHWAMPDTVLDALALSYVAKPVSEAIGSGAFRVASDLGDGPAIVAYYSVATEESAIMLRDISWLSEAFRQRGLRVIAISIDGPDHVRDVLAEMRWRNYPYDWVVDTPEHAARISTSRDMPIGFLIDHGRVLQRSFGIDRDRGRTIWGGMRVQMLLDEILPSAGQRQENPR